MSRPQQATSVGSTLPMLIGFGLLVAAHFGVRPLFTGRASVDFFVIAVLFAAVRLRPGIAAVVGCLSGLTIDAFAPGSFGAATLVMSCIAFGASWTKAVFFADHFALTTAFLFVGKWTFDIGYLLVGGGTRGTELMVQLLIWAPLSAAGTALVGLLLVATFRPLLRPRGG